MTQTNNNYLDMAAVTLRDYQDEALCKMKNGCILNGGVGSGKSRTSLAYYYVLQGGRVYYYKKDPVTKTYTVGPYYHGGDRAVSGRPSYQEMTNPKDLYIITPAQKRDKDEWNDELVDFLMSTDPSLNKYNNKVVVDSWNNIGKYTDVKDAFFIFDEQRVRGYGVWTKSFLKIAKNNQWILLSATPGDKWEDYIPVFIANGFYRNKTDFCDKHVKWNNFTPYPSISGYINEPHLMRLRRDILISMDFDRDTLQHHKHIICDYDNVAYDSITKTKWNPYKDKPIENAGEYCLCLRRLVNSDKSRQIKLLEIVNEHPKAIIFYNHDYELEMLRKLFEKYPHAEWNGHKHEPIPDKKLWVYLVQYGACEAWNCTTTDTIIFYSQNYSYWVMEQAAGRIDRCNTPFRDLYYYHLRSESKIDNQIRLALKKKKKFNEKDFAPFWDKKKSATNKVEEVLEQKVEEDKEYINILDYCEEYNSWDHPLEFDDEDTEEKEK